MAFFDRLLRAGEGRILRKLAGIAEQVNLIEEDMVALSDAELRTLLNELGDLQAVTPTEDDVVVPAIGRGGT